MSARTGPAQGLAPKDIAMSEFRRLRQILISADRYQQAVSKPWFGPVRMTSFLIVTILTVVIAVFANVGCAPTNSNSGTLTRIQRIDGAPTFSTADAPFFLRYAHFYNTSSSTAEVGRISTNQTKLTNQWAERLDIRLAVFSYVIRVVLRH